MPVRSVRWEAGGLVIEVANEQLAKLSVFDVRGKRLTPDMSLRLDAGKNSIVLREIPPGLAWVRIESGDAHGTILVNSLQRGLISVVGGQVGASRGSAVLGMDTLRFLLSGRVLARISDSEDSLFASLGLDTSLAFPWNESIPYGQLVDDRDHQVYRTVRIGRQRWMAENLYYKPSENGTSWCYDNKPLSCVVHGRLYSLHAAMGGYPSSSRNPSGFRGVCPSGWHMPSDSEWRELQAFVGEDSAPLVKLFARGSWTNSDVKAKARDSLGFRAIASGECWSSIQTTFASAGNGASFWSITDTTNIPNSFELNATKPFVTRYVRERGNGYSVRCVEGDTTYPLKLSPPALGPSFGVYDTIQSLTFSLPLPGATIHCTTDGSAPDSTSPACPSTLVIDRNMTVRAVATYPGMFASSEASRRYVIKGRLSDARDGKLYRTVVIGAQTWMAENLNFDPGGDKSRCYEDRDKNCLSRGRLYSWRVAMNLPDSCASSSCSTLVEPKHQGICPDGWRMPSQEDWNVLMVAAGNDSLVGKRLKSTYYWKNYVQEGARSGTDEFGFNALPGGYQVFNVFLGGPDLATANISEGTTGVWISASEFDPQYVGGMYLYSNSDQAKLSFAIGKAESVSLRCIKSP